MTTSKPIPPEQRAEAWSDSAEGYEVFAEAVTSQFAEDAVRLVHIKPGSHVLDVAAGTGAFSLAAARRGAEVLATDFSAGMLDKLASKSAAQGLSVVQTAIMDGQALQVADGSFDIVASLFGLMFFPDHDRGLRELLRALKPAGQAVVTTWAPPPRGEMLQLMGRAMAKAIPNMRAPETPPHWAALGDIDDLLRRLLSVGFARAQALSVTHLWAFESPEWLVEQLRSIAPPAAELFAAITAEQREAFTQAIVEELRERQGDGPFGLTYEGLIAVGTKAAA